MFVRINEKKKEGKKARILLIKYEFTDFSLLWKCCLCLWTVFFFSLDKASSLKITLDPIGHVTDIYFYCFHYIVEHNLFMKNCALESTLLLNWCFCRKLALTFPKAPCNVVLTGCRQNDQRTDSSWFWWNHTPLPANVQLSLLIH